LIIINRPQVVLPHDTWMQELLKKHEIVDAKKLQLKPGGYIFQHDMEPMLISATEMRRKLKANQDVSQQIDPDVLRYIKQHHLYE